VLPGLAEGLAVGPSGESGTVAAGAAGETACAGVAGAAGMPEPKARQPALPLPPRETLELGWPQSVLVLGERPERGREPPGNGNRLGDGAAGATADGGASMVISVWARTACPPTRLKIPQ
jgi:hypothetical protein